MAIKNMDRMMGFERDQNISSFFLETGVMNKKESWKNE